MKKFALALCATVMALVCVFAAGCSLFASAPKVAGNTYKLRTVEYDSKDMANLSAAERQTASDRASYYRTEETGKTIAFSDDGKVTYTSANGAVTTVDYKQSGVNVLVPEGPYKNTNYNGEIVCGYTVKKDDDGLLYWKQTFTFENGTNHTFEITITYYLSATTNVD